MIDKLGAKHQLCVFHLMSNLMKPLNKRAGILNRKIESKEKNINDINNKISKLKSEYPYKQGRPPKSDKKANKNLQNRRNLKKEKSELKQKFAEYKKELNELIYYKDKIKVMFNSKTFKTAIKRFNMLWDKNEELPSIIYDFLKKLSKKLNRVFEYTKDRNIPKTNNLVELFYGVTFPMISKEFIVLLKGQKIGLD